MSKSTISYEVDEIHDPSHLLIESIPSPSISSPLSANSQKGITNDHGTWSIFGFINSISNQQQFDDPKESTKKIKIHNDMSIMDIYAQTLARRKTALTDLKAIYIRLSELKKSQQIALEKQDYTSASTISKQSRSIELTISSLKTQLISLDSSLVNLREKHTNELLCMFEQREACANNFQQNLEQEIRQSEEAEKRENKRVDREQIELDKASKLIESEKTETEKEIKIALEKVDNVEKRIDSHAHIERSEQRQLIQNRDEIRQEIQDLLDRLSILRRQEGELNDQIAELDMRITSSSIPFSQERAQSSSELALAKSHLDLVHRKEKMLQEAMKAYKEAGKVYEKNQEERKQKMETIRLRISIIKEESVILKSESEVMENISKIMSETQKTFQNRESELEKHSEELRIKEVFVRNMTLRQLHCQSRSSRLRQELTSLENRIPGLEEQMRTSASSGDYKTAELSQKIIREIMDRIGILENELKIIQDEINKLESNIEIENSLLKDMREVLEKQESEIGTELIQILNNAKDELEIKRNYDFKISNAVLTVELEILDAHIDFVKTRYFK